MDAQGTRPSCLAPITVHDLGSEGLTFWMLCPMAGKLVLAVSWGLARDADRDPSCSLWGPPWRLELPYCVVTRLIR
jgi:hypothetical protein